MKILKPFQESGVKFLCSRPHALLADEPGLGKTVQAIAAADLLALRRPLVVCPASVRTRWLEEAGACGSRVRWGVVSYEEAVKWRSRMLGEGYDGLILDEAHFLKTANSQRTQAIFGPEGLARSGKLKVRWALTGTPILNRPRELWPVLKSLHPGFARMSWSAFAQRYCGAYFNGRELDTRGASNLEELRRSLDGFMLRRAKSDVLKELPRRIVTRVLVELSKEGKEYVEAAELEIAGREQKLSAAAEDFSALGDLSRLLHATGVAKVEGTVRFVLDLLTVQEKVVVFYRHTSVLDNITKRLAAAQVLTFNLRGGMDDAAKREAVHRFRQHKGPAVFVGQIQAAGTGVDGLQDVASSVVFAELSWVPGEMSQAVDRLHRMGAKSASVNAYLLHAPGTMESTVLGVQNRKGSVVGRLMGEDGWNI